MGISKAAFLLLFFLSSVQGSVLDRYVRTEGAWLLNPMKQVYSANSDEECAEKCETEEKFACRAFLFTSKDQKCLTLAENTKAAMIFRRANAVLYEKRIDCMHCNGENYHGVVATTTSGLECQRWDSQEPHSHKYLPENFPDKDLKNNYCRNPDGQTRPWCFTTSPTKRWEYCDIPRCTTPPPPPAPGRQCLSGRGEDYRGTISVTESGNTCQHWSSQSPHRHTRTPEKYPCRGLDENYCRNPDGEKRPWCYTTNTTARWEYCNIPSCDSAKPEAPVDCMHCNGENYHGVVATTTSGLECQRWDSQEPHSHKYLPENFPDKDLKNNYCRNPDGQTRPWCFTTSPTIRWEYCDIPRCTTPPPPPAPGRQCLSGRGEDYRGTISVTESGNTCQHWSSQSPHRHTRAPENYPCRGLDENYCRNPDGEKRPWCYTTNTTARWEYCNIPSCDSAKPEAPVDCMHCNGENYHGVVATTTSGLECQRWDSQEPHSHKYLPENFPDKDLKNNYCRNPDGQTRPWCFTTSPTIRWEYCDIPRCTTPPPPPAPGRQCLSGRGEDYRGTISVTESGNTCQHWSSQSPHRHTRAPENYPCRGLDENYCRNPDGEKRPWCYTTNTTARWEYCNIPSCDSAKPEAPVDCMHCNGENYHGVVATTTSGLECQRWDSQEPHSHKYLPENFPDKDLKNNYCRNPDGQTRPWCFTTSPTIRWEYCDIPRCTTPPPPPAPGRQCLSGRGEDYRGTISVTESGNTCQHWSSQSPHRHTRTPEKYPCRGLDENYCRNPDGEKRPWCYTTNTTARWEYCNIPSCDSAKPEAPVDCMHCNGENYHGVVATTTSGLECQRWDSQEPHSHKYLPENFPDKDLKNNYCRNPDGQTRPWCFTTSPTIRWEYCDIPRCTTPPPPPAPGRQCLSGRGEDYRGTISVTESGNTCQHWSSQSPHRHTRAPENYPCRGLDENYCRNPDGEKRPWCYTTNTTARWEYCNIPSCDSAKPEAPVDCMHCNGENYHGVVATTTSGLECQRWDSQEPHSHKYLPENFPDKDLKNNYCRNPDGQTRPWCFTTSPTIRWEYCDIPRCTTPPPPPAPGRQCLSGRGEDYRGTISVTESGNTCQHWSSQSPHRHTRAPENYPCRGLDENYCRNPDGEKRPWCYTTNTTARWEYCNIPSCDSAKPEAPVDCMHCNGENYHGVVATTTSGLECQRWDSQEPHSHKYLPENFPDKDLKNNYCRNPDGQTRPWCFTTSPTIRWEYCDIPRCTTPPPPPAPGRQCLSGRGEDYRGTISVTESGNTCQHWSSQSPHRHTRTPEKYPCRGLDENYCRNPDGEKRPWCYTTNTTARWEYCNIPSCDSAKPEAPVDCMHCNGENYHGVVATTTSGLECQRWDSQEPHSHKYLPENFPDKDLKNNYCRNPDGQTRPWCFTTSPTKRWEYCDIPRCSESGF